jgi:heptosyltransferase-2
MHKRRCRCPLYEPMGFRILIIKLGALGDIVRTACLLPTLKRTYPQSHITWISKDNGVRILSGHPMIDRLVTFDSAGILSITQQTFDLVLSCDKDPGPIALCNAVSSPDKRGICMSQWGTSQPCGVASEPYFELGLDDDLKFNGNSLSYPELIHSALGLDYVREPYRLFCDEASTARARNMFEPWRNASGGPIVGINTGAGSVYANKAPNRSRWIELCRELVARGYGVVLLGGPNEADDHAAIVEQAGWGVFSSGCNNTEQQFVAIVDQCDLIVTGDTLALHVAIAREVPVVALFGPTCAQEIDLFGLGTKIVSELDCAPCYRRECNKSPNCMDAISVERILAEVLTLCQPHDSSTRAKRNEAVLVEDTV